MRILHSEDPGSEDVAEPQNLVDAVARLRCCGYSASEVARLLGVGEEEVLMAQAIWRGQRSGEVL